MDSTPVKVSPCLPLTIMIHVFNKVLLIKKKQVTESAFGCSFAYCPSGFDSVCVFELNFIRSIFFKRGKEF